jgi:hypothetical protein
MERKESKRERERDGGASSRAQPRCVSLKKDDVLWKERWDRISGGEKEETAKEELITWEARMKEGGDRQAAVKEYLGIGPPPEKSGQWISRTGRRN